MRPYNPDNLVILGVAASDSHAVANQIIARYLRDNGFDVLNLGVCTPVEDFMLAHQECGGALAIAIGSLNGHAIEDLQDLPAAKRDYQVTCPVFVGGNLSVGSRKSQDIEARILALDVAEILRSPEELLQRLETLKALRQRQREEIAAIGEVMALQRQPRELAYAH